MKKNRQHIWQDTHIGTASVHTLRRLCHCVRTPLSHYTSWRRCISKLHFLQSSVPCSRFCYHTTAASALYTSVSLCSWAVFLFWVGTMITYLWDCVISFKVGSLLPLCIILSSNFCFCGQHTLLHSCSISYCCIVIIRHSGRDGRYIPFEANNTVP